MDTIKFIRAQCFIFGVIYALWGGGMITLSILGETNGMVNTRVPMHFSSFKWIDCKVSSHELIYGLEVMDAHHKLRARDFCNKTMSDRVFFYTENVWLDVSIGWMTSIMFTISAIFYLLYGTLLWNIYKQTLLDSERFRFRWIEQSITGAMTMFVTANFVGQQNVYILVSLSVGIFFIIMTPSVGAGIPKSIYVHAAFGHAITWAYLIGSFFANTFSVFAHIPIYVYIVLITQFFLFSVFPFALAIECRRVKNGHSLVGTETFNNVCNCLSKVLIGVISIMMMFSK